MFFCLTVFCPDNTLETDEAGRLKKEECLKFKMTVCCEYLGVKVSSLLSILDCMLRINILKGLWDKIEKSSLKRKNGCSAGNTEL